MTVQIAVVIPTWNEAERIGPVVSALRRAEPAPCRIVVADCDSTDGTPDLAREAGADVVITGRGLCSRASALNAGAAEAAGGIGGAGGGACDAVFFLHADTDPPAGWPGHIAAVLADPTVVGGAFKHHFRTDHATAWQRARLRVIVGCNRARYRVTRIYFGDQGLFVRPAAFKQAGGFPDLDLMEDVVFCQRLRRLGPVRLANARITTSPRRFLRHGIFRQALIDQSMLLAHALRLPAGRLHAWYNREKQ